MDESSPDFVGESLMPEEIKPADLLFGFATTWSPDFLYNLVSCPESNPELFLKLEMGSDLRTPARVLSGS